VRAGKLDRRLTIERKTVSYSDSGEPQETWSTLAVVWAQARPDRGDERFAAKQLVGRAVTSFHLRHRADLALTVQDRLRYDGLTWDILDLRGIGRGVGTEIDAAARAD